MSLPPVDIRGKQSAIVTLSIPAGQIAPSKVVGQFLYLVSCPVPVKIRLDGQPFIDAKQGTGLEVPDPATFEWFEVWNTSAATITVKVYAGFARYVDQRLAVIDAQTDADGWNGTQLLANSGQTFDGVGTGVYTGRQRRAIVVSNKDPSLSLAIRDADTHEILTVFAQTSITLPVSGSVQVYNPNPSAVACAIGELWWIQP